MEGHQKVWPALASVSLLVGLYKPRAKTATSTSDANHNGTMEHVLLLAHIVMLTLSLTRYFLERTKAFRSVWKPDLCSAI